MNHSIYDHDGRHTAHCEHDEKSSAAPVTQELIIEGAGCASCVGVIERAINKISGVVKAAMNSALHTVSVTGTVQTERLIEVAESADYTAKNINSKPNGECWYE